MKIRTIVEWHIIEAATKEEWAEQYAAFIQRTKGKVEAETWNTSRGTHCLYIKTVTSEEIPQNLKEEYELRGETYHCSDCPELIESTDARRKRLSCKVCQSTRADAPACNHFYQLLERGEVSL